MDAECVCILLESQRNDIQEKYLVLKDHRHLGERKSTHAVN